MKLLASIRNTTSIGQSAEKQAARHLQEHGLKIVRQNFRCKGGEIDIIARDNETLVFVEVRHRKSNRFGTPGETVTYKKQQRIILAAQFFLQTLKTQPQCRFDVIESRPGEASEINFNWIKDAFGC
ncbi:YraN family protein [Hahella sp. CCB-MM4]|uniref:YraN family protein n=1 Tax=Hahella sp. (strain CCB-MM4) TaxID=1926491 RepID=UPI000B9BD8B8|nr:YraN family protein [Hahella sp. CCB-MM4]OZG71996.1 YraN family protein [Hahella sp. CCB-MM4]